MALPSVTDVLIVVLLFDILLVLLFLGIDLAYYHHYERTLNK